VILVDANILIYAFDEDSPRHAVAREWLEDRLNESTRVALPWTSLLAFLRIVTNPRVMHKPSSMAGARAQVRLWLESPAVWIPTPGDRHLEVLDRLLATPGVQGNLVMDAHIAALAIEHGLRVNSTDSDFARFPGLDWIDPLAGKS
jgi:uncharacterized protein